MSLVLRRILLFLIRSADFGSRSSAQGSFRRRRSVGTTPRHYSRLVYLQLINYERTHYSGSTGDNPRSRFRLPDKVVAIMQQRDWIRPLKSHADGGSFADSSSLRRWTQALAAAARSSSESRRYYGEDFRTVGEAQMAGWDLYCLNVGP